MNHPVPKQWSVQAISPAAGPLDIRRGGATPDLNRIGPGLVTPVELLLASVAACFALSCHAAFAQRRLERTAFKVGVTGRKAPQLPSRLEEIHIEADFDGLSGEDARAVAALAKQMCTVTNTLACALDVVARAATVGQA